MSKSIRHVEVFEIVTHENYNEERYLLSNPDIALAVKKNTYSSGWRHFKRHGGKEYRKQESSSYHEDIIALRKEKAERIKTIFKKGVLIEQDDTHVFDYTGDERRRVFDFLETAKVSSFFYDQIPLDILNDLPDGLILDCGAGFRPVYYENVVNYEIASYPTTDVLGFAEDLPFADNSFDAVFSFAVLEHIKFPFQAAGEICRVLKPGGKLAVCAAFLQPLHGFPHHYFNMTNLGLKVLFEKEIDIERQFVESGTGPINSLTWFLRRWADSLPLRERKQFLKAKVGDLLGQPHEYFDKGFVSCLPEENRLELASATSLVGSKKYLKTKQVI
ncbi:MAG: methyltransferase domain-containing protein [Proteobacteria bacterium]|nr:methyltransferase domain-containing protein [Pseudomonadota bacterium]